jgi:hypothetical protein
MYLSDSPRPEGCAILDENIATMENFRDGGEFARSVIPNVEKRKNYKFIRSIASNVPSPCMPVRIRMAKQFKQHKNGHRRPARHLLQN